MNPNVPVTVWRVADSNGEAGQSDNANIITLSGLLLTTLSGSQLIINEGSYTPIPASTWIQDDSE